MNKNDILSLMHEYYSQYFKLKKMTDIMGSPRNYGSTRIRRIPVIKRLKHFNRAALALMLVVINRDSILSTPILEHWLVSQALKEISQY